MNPKQIANALSVIVNDPKISTWLKENDPKAWGQCREALGIGPASAKKMNKIEAARQIREAAKAWRAEGDSDYAKEHEISDAYYDDAKQLRKVAKLVREGKREKALEMACDLDTIVKEEIPQPAWDFLQENS